jgi:hypothetical protein
MKATQRYFVNHNMRKENVPAGTLTSKCGSDQSFTRLSLKMGRIPEKLWSETEQTHRTC